MVAASDPISKYCQRAREQDEESCQALGKLFTAISTGKDASVVAARASCTAKVIKSIREQRELCAQTLRELQRAKSLEKEAKLEMFGRLLNAYSEFEIQREGLHTRQMEVIQMARDFLDRENQALESKETAALRDLDILKKAEQELTDRLEEKGLTLSDLSKVQEKTAWRVYLHFSRMFPLAFNPVPNAILKEECLALQQKIMVEGMGCFFDKKIWVMQRRFQMQQAAMQQQMMAAQMQMGFHPSFPY